MHWQASFQQLSKFALALRVALHLAFVHSKRLDSVALYILQCELPTCKTVQASDTLALFKHLEQRGFTLDACQQVCSKPLTSLPIKADIKYWLGDALEMSVDEPVEFAFEFFCMSCLPVNWTANGW